MPRMFLLIVYLFGVQAIIYPLKANGSVVMAESVADVEVHGGICGGCADDGGGLRAVVLAVAPGAASQGKAFRGDVVRA